MRIQPALPSRPLTFILPFSMIAYIHRDGGHVALVEVGERGR